MTAALAPEQLLAHHDDGTPWPATLPSPAFDDVAEAYRTALTVRQLRQARGEQPRGFKIGFTNRQIWERYRVYAPIWGTVWNTTLTMTNGAGRIALQHTCEPRIEPELVFGLKHTPPSGADLQALFEALDWLAPGVEIVQSHRPGWRFASAAETVADGGLHARLLVGQPLPVARLGADAAALQQALAHASLQLSKGGTPVEQGVGANVLDDPLQALLHFLNELRACPGAPDLQAGDVVTTGTWTDAWPVAPGEHWRVSYSDGLGALDVAFD